MTDTFSIYEKDLKSEIAQLKINMRNARYKLQKIQTYKNITNNIINVYDFYMVDFKTFKTLKKSKHEIIKNVDFKIGFSQNHYHNLYRLKVPNEPHHNFLTNMHHSFKETYTIFFKQFNERTGLELSSDNLIMFVYINNSGLLNTLFLPNLDTNDLMLMSMNDINIDPSYLNINKDMLNNYLNKKKCYMSNYITKKIINK